MSVRETVRGTVERWCPGGFVVGGVGILGTSIVGSVDVAGVVSAPGWLAMGPLLFGLWFVFVGLTGLYPRVAERSSRLSRGGRVTAAIALVIWTATILAAVVVDLTTARTFANPGSWGPPLLAGAFVLALVSFLAYGIGSARTSTPSRTIGVLLLVPVVAFLGQAVLLGSKILTGEVIAVLQLGLGGVIGVALLAVGYLLHTGGRGASGMESPAEPTA